MTADELRWAQVVVVWPGYSVGRELGAPLVWTSFPGQQGREEFRGSSGGSRTLDWMVPMSSGWMESKGPLGCGDLWCLEPPCVPWVVVGLAGGVAIPWSLCVGG